MTACSLWKSDSLPPSAGLNGTNRQSCLEPFRTQSCRMVRSETPDEFGVQDVVLCYQRWTFQVQKVKIQDFVPTTWFLWWAQYSHKGLKAGKRNTLKAKSLSLYQELGPIFQLSYILLTVLKIGLIWCPGTGLIHCTTLWGPTCHGVPPGRQVKALLPWRVGEPWSVPSDVSTPNTVLWTEACLPAPWFVVALTGNEFDDPSPTARMPCPGTDAVPLQSQSGIKAMKGWEEGGADFNGDSCWWRRSSGLSHLACLL